MPVLRRIFKVISFHSADQTLHSHSALAKEG